MKSRAGSRVSWIEVPDPLPEWTLEQQQVVIDILKEHPKAVRDAVQLELAMTKAYKRIPTKTAPDLHECLRHIEASRIAFFGKRQTKKSSCLCRLGHPVFDANSMEMHSQRLTGHLPLGG